MKKKILIVGAGGFMGRQLVPALRESFSIVAISKLLSSPFPADVVNVAHPFGSSGEYSGVLADCSAVVWLASTSTPGSSVGNPLKELDENLRPFFMLLSALQQHPQCELLYISTGGAIYGDVSGGRASEDLRLCPKSYYSAGKAAAEHFISAFCHQYGCRATILRPSNVYGQGQTCREGFGIIPAAFNALVNDSEFTIWGGGETVRDYLNIDDFTALCGNVLTRSMTATVSTFNASSGNAVSVDELLAAIERITGKALRRNYRQPRSIDVSRIVLDNSKTRAAFDWQPSVELDQGLERAWQWFQNNRP